MIDIAVGKPLPNTVGFKARLRQLDPEQQSGSGGKWSAGKRPHACSVAPHTAAEGGMQQNPAGINGYKANCVQ